MVIVLSVLEGIEGMSMVIGSLSVHCSYSFFLSKALFSFHLFFLLFFFCFYYEHLDTSLYVYFILGLIGSLHQLVFVAGFYLSFLCIHLYVFV